MPTVSAGSVKLYYEVRGTGPPALLIVGATGDAGHLAPVAEALADEFTAVTYDRRGNSRSPPPAGWSATSVDEQADDAAALLGALGLAPAAVFGTSAGGVCALGLTLRHPEAVRGVILHEPSLYSVLRHPEETLSEIAALVQEGLAAGGEAGAVAAFWRHVGGDAAWDGLAPDVRERMIANAGTFFGMERAPFAAWRPDDAALRAVAVPVQLLVGEESLPFFAEIVAWLVGPLGAEVGTAAGTHTPYVDRPGDLARTIRPLLRRVSSGA